MNDYMLAKINEIVMMTGLICLTVLIIVFMFIIKDAISDRFKK